MRAASAKERISPGLALAFAIAAVAFLLLRSVQAVPPVVGALVIGIVVGNAGARRWATGGARFIVRYGLRAAIIALGAGLNLGVVAGRGLPTLLAIATLVTVAMTLGLVLSRLAGVEQKVAVLLGVGTAICGASAILAVSPIIRAREKDTAYAIATIFAFNIVALLLLPPIGHLLGLSDVRFGTWVGTAVNDTSVVVATGYVYGQVAGTVATLVKLTRTILLIPLSIVVGILFGEDSSKASLVDRARATMPWFVLGYFGLAIANTTHVIGTETANGIAYAGSLMLIAVLAAVGLGVDLQGIWKMGGKPIAIGFSLATTMAVISFGLVSFLKIG